MSSLCLRLRRPDIAPLDCSLPGDQLQIEHEDGIQHGHQQQLNKGRDAQAADLRVAQGLPQRPAVQR